ncbi:hypothetical protein Sjap_001329 [Stephania japonica]|uniref:Glabrous enhancer-binding protein-like DBD domain-containing protein n=1 Tax=Stephania japonica TaxID=461633 RepID=A0AAP0PTE4_9MAGN
MSSQRKRRAAAAAAAAPPAPETPTEKHHRLSEKDEILLLQSFLEISNTSPSPDTAAATLFDRVAKTLTVDVTHARLIESLRNLRTRFSNQALIEPFSAETLTPHEREVFDLSRKIWGPRDAHAASNASTSSASRIAKEKKKKKSRRRKTNHWEVTLIPPKEETLTLIGDEVKEGPIGGFDLGEKFPFLMEEMGRLGSSEAMMAGLRRLGRSELQRLDEKWRDQQIKEAKLAVMKGELARDAKGLVLEALSSG